MYIYIYIYIRKHTTEADILACPSMRWLGIHANDLDLYGVPHTVKLPLTKNDKKKIASMLKRKVRAGKYLWIDVCMYVRTYTHGEAALDEN
jgi:hypothetical protein